MRASPSPTDRSGSSGKSLFVAGLIIYLAAQGMVVVPPALHPRSPVEMDDAYTYMIKAAEMQSCFRQDCAALRDLRAQLTAPTEDAELAWHRYRGFSRLFIVYHPLHSALMVGLRSLGLTWEVAYHVLWVAGWVLISLGLAYWSAAIFGPGPAGIGLFLLAFSLFPLAGLHYVTPSTLSLGVAMFAWGIVAGKGPGRTWLILVCMATMMLLHPMGRIYAGITLAYVFLMDQGAFLKRLRPIQILGWVFIATSFLLPLVIDRPLLSFSRDPNPAGWDLWQGLSNNIKDGVNVVRLWVYSYGGPAPVALAMGVGLVTLDRVHRHRVLRMLAPLLLILPVSLFQILPRYPAELFVRLWIPLAILLTGLLGQTLMVWIRSNFEWFCTAVACRRTKPTDGDGDPDRRWFSLVFTVASLAAIYQFALPRFQTSFHEWQVMRDRFSDFDRLVFDVSQPATITQTDDPCGPVLYESEEMMHFFFMYGTLQCGAVFHPAVKNAVDSDIWLKASNGIKYVVAWNPIRMIRPLDGGFVIESGEKLEIQSPVPLEISTISVLMEAIDGDAVVDIGVGAAGDSGEHHILNLPAGTPITWLPAEVSTTSRVIGLHLVPPSASVLIMGIRTTPSDTLQWPWDKGISLTVYGSSPAVPPKLVHFDVASSTLGLPHNPAAPARVVADEGHSILIRLGQ